MKKTLIGIGAILLVAGMTGMASATAINFDLAGSTGGSYVSVTDSAPLATLTANLASDLDDQIFTLNDGETRAVDFFTLTASGFALWPEYDITATLAFDLPEIDAAGSGGGHFFTIGGIISAGTLSWDPATLPDTFVDAFGNTISVDFEDGWTIGLGNTATVHAYITNQGGGTAPVPEPATMLLMGTGLAGLVAARRKKSKKA
ncbi:MAG: PEP-CTERM sorting domain-containing protein [Deltaproteobacteria bacterium]|nr:PEP-CTERM sorting domain-containing protein [Deltaproteobacteria bacterium]